jgi:hypothetical protein
MAGNGWHRKEKAIACLLKADSIEQASAECGVSTRTFTRWLRQPDFQRLMREAKNRLIDVAINEIVTSAKGAAIILRSISADPDAPASARVSASKAILLICIESAQVAELQERLDQLEKKTINGNINEWKPSYEVQRTAEAT